MRAFKASNAAGGRSFSVTTSSQRVEVPGHEDIMVFVTGGATVYLNFGSGSGTAGTGDGAFTYALPSGFYGVLGVPLGSTHMAYIGTAVSAFIVTPGAGI